MTQITKEAIEAAVEEIRKVRKTPVWDRWTDHDAIGAVLEAALPFLSSPGKDGGQEVEAVKTVWQVADAIDPERSPDGGWRDQLLNEIHADLENRGRRDKDFAVTVHHRNIVISAVSKALRGLPSVSKEAAPMKDHARGCEGRNYTCTCGHDAKRDDLIDRLTKALEPFCKHYEPWMERWDDQEASSTFSRHTFGDLREALAAINEARAAVSSTSREGER